MDPSATHKVVDQVRQVQGSARREVAHKLGSGHLPARVFWGAGLVLLGAVLLLERSGLLGRGLTRLVWPLLLVAAGLWRLLLPGWRASGVWLLTAGTLLLLHFEGLASLQRTWPVFVVTAGASIIVETLDRRRLRAGEEE